MVKTFKRSIAWLLTLAMLMTFVPIFALTASAAVTASKPTVGDGTEASPYEITTAEELKWFQQSASKSAWAKLMNNITYNENVIVNGAVNSNVSGVSEWTPIGNRSYPYTGTFDGGGYYISGLYCTSTYTSNYRGLFGCVDGATIKNLTIKDSYFYSTNDQYVATIAGATKDMGNGVIITDCHNVNSIVYCPGYAAGILGNNQRATAVITNCTNSGAITGSNTSGGYAGGIVGYLNRGSATISGCNNSGTINSGSGDAGGIVGSLSSATGTIANCTNTGTVRYMEGTSGRAGALGGIASRNSLAMANCDNKGKIIGYRSIGGIAGYNSGSMVNCTNSGAVIAECATEGYAGGLVYSNSNTISNCSNSADITGWRNLGGLACYNRGTISDCYNTGDIIATSTSTSTPAYSGGLLAYVDSSNSEGTIKDSYNSGAVSGNVGVGGVAGCVRSTATFTNCYNTGSVTGTGTASKDIGGLFGYFSPGSAGMTDGCYNAASVSGHENVGGVAGTVNSALTSCHNTGSVEGTTYVGGVVGYVSNGTSFVVSKCYNTGDVLGESSVGGVAGYARRAVENSYNTGSVEGTSSVGGVVGSQISANYVKYCYNVGTVTATRSFGSIVSYSAVTSCYYLNTSVTGGSTISGATALTKEQMTDNANWKTNFAGFDTTTPVWTKNNNEGTKGYLPKLDTYAPYLTVEPAHEHNWSYTASGDTITAICSNADGKCPDAEQTMIISAPANLVYDGNEKSATISGAIDGVETPEIVYKKGSEVLSGKPVEPGTYTASITLDTNKTAAVIYTIKPSYQIAASASVAAGGTVSGGGTFEENTSVTLTAVVNDGYVFAGWMENGSLIENATETSYTFTATKDRTVVAVFKKLYTITVDIDGGTLTAEANTEIAKYGIVNNNGILTGVFPEGTKVNIKIADSKTYITKTGYFVSGFTDGTNTFTQDTEITVSADKNYKILWQANPKYTATVTNGTGDGDFEENATVTVTADNPQVGKKFSGWTSADGVVFADSSAMTTTFKMPAKAVTVTANYVDKETVTITKDVQKYTYDTQAKAFEIKGTGLSGFSVKYQQNNADVTPVNAGAYDVVITRAEDDTYKTYEEKIVGGLVIEKAQASIAIDTAHIAKKYGEILELPAATTNFGTVTVDKTVADMKNAGIYTVTYSVAETSNWKGATKTVNVIINKKPVEILWGTSSFVYDGTEKSITATVNNKVGDDVVNVTLSGNTATNTGNYTATVTAVDNANYTIVGGRNLSKDWTILKSTTDYVDGIKVYNGTEEGSEFIYGDIITLKVKPAATGVAYASLTAPGSAQMAVFLGTEQISEAESADANGEYELYVDTTTANLGYGDITLTAKYVGNDNMADHSEDITVTLEKADVSITTAPAANTLVYNQSAQTLITAGEGVDGGTLKYKLEGGEYSENLPTATDAGDYTVYYKIFGDENHKDSQEVSVTVTIAEKTINPVVLLTAPVVNEYSVKEIETDEYTATVSWLPGVLRFTWETVYTATITITPKTNYTVTGVAENGYTVIGATVTNEADSNVLSAKFAKTAAVQASGTGFFKVTFETNGGSRIDVQSVRRNTPAHKPSTPKKAGYTFVGWYTDATLTEEYDFTENLRENITLYAKWAEGEDADSHICPSLAFSDLNVNAWYHEATDYVIENGLMNGTEKTRFAPNSNLTRAMLVTILYRNEGEPAVNRSIPFADVDVSAYYANAVIWAQQNGIVKGISETEFAPNADITREQIATIIYRYAEYKGMETVTLEENLHFDDASEISEYAVQAINWAVGTGLLKGRTDNTLNPRDNATRAEIATILKRFIESNK